MPKGRKAEASKTPSQAPLVDAERKTPATKTSPGATAETPSHPHRQQAKRKTSISRPPIRILLGTSSTKGKSDRARILVRILHKLVPSLPNLMKAGIKEQREALENFTDSPKIKEYARTGPMHFHEFFGMLLDWAQSIIAPEHHLGKASIYATKHRPNKEYVIDLDKLAELGIYPESWEVRLAAATLIAMNKAPADGSGAAPPSKRAAKQSAVSKKKDARVISYADERRQGRLSRLADHQETAATLQDGAGTSQQHGKKPRRAAAVAAVDNLGVDNSSDEEGEWQEYYQEQPAAKSAGKQRRVFKKQERPPGKKKRSPPAATALATAAASKPTKVAAKSKSTAIKPAKGANSASTAAGGGGGRASGSSAIVPTLIQEHAIPCYWLDRQGHWSKHWTNTQGAGRPEDMPEDLESKACHICQAQHVIHRCQDPSCNKTFCLKCTKQYEYLFTSQPGDVLEPLLNGFCQGSCPCCLSICIAPRCMRQHRSGDGEKHVQPPQLEPAVRRELALHAVSYLREPLRQLLEAGNREISNQGKVGEQLEVVAGDASRSEPVRLLCNRCATCLEDVHLHCEDCEADYCTACTADLANTRPIAARKIPVSIFGAAATQCPLCLSDYTVLKRVLGQEMIAKLQSVDALVQRAQNDEQQRAAPALANGTDTALARDSRTHPIGIPPLRRTISSEKHRNSPAIANGRQPPQRLLLLPDKNKKKAPAAAAPPPPPSGAAASAPALTTCLRQYLNMNSSIIDEINAQSALQAVVRALQTGRLLMPQPLPDAEAIELQRLLDADQQQHSNGEAVSGPSNGSMLQQPQQPAAIPAAAATGPLAAPAAAPVAAAWHVDLPPEDYRLASQRPNGAQNYIWTPHVSAFSPSSPRYSETLERFRQRWALGEPIVVRGFRGKLQWGPEDMTRASRNLSGGSESDKTFPVIDCNDWSMQEMSSAKFFRRYRLCSGATTDANGNPLQMLKLKDFPPNAEFREKCRRHHDDFLEMLNLCVPAYSHPDGFLNLASALPESYIPPDLGPKGYIAFGREEEHAEPGDSVTRLHKDMSDAINILCHAQQEMSPNTPEGCSPQPVARCGDALPQAPSFGGAGALWDLWRREDLPGLRQFVEDVINGRVPGCPPFYFKDATRPLGPQDVSDVIHDQSIMITEAHRKVLAEKYGIHSWMIEQYQWEGVFIPAGCAHQVRNLRACIKVALDFVSPESVHQCLAQREEIRQLAMREHPEHVLTPGHDPAERHFVDKLQVANMVLFGVARAATALEEQQS